MIAPARPRPKHEPRAVKCPSCGAGFGVQDEAARLAVCGYCGAHLRLGEVEATVLSSGGAANAVMGRRLPYRIGDRFVFGGGRYEVVARLVFIEDGDRSERTEEYVLYSPRRGSLFLDEYKGDWSLSRPVHVMPRSNDVFSLSEGAVVETYDGAVWTFDEAGERELVYVDGALPWEAKVGDRVRFAELTGQGGEADGGLWAGGRALYEVELSDGELEINRGRTLTPGEVKRAARPKSGTRPSNEALRPPPRMAERRARPAPERPARGDRGQVSVRIIAAAVLAMLVNLGAAGWAATQGTDVGSWRVSAAELGGERLVGPFELPAGVARVDVEAPSLDGAWLAVDLALVTDDDRVTHVLDSDLAYYHGVEDGESWSEGARSESTYLRVDQPGRYRLLVRGSGNSGETESAGRASAGIELRVVAGARQSVWFLAAGLFSTLVLGLAVWQRRIFGGAS